LSTRIRKRDQRKKSSDLEKRALDISGDFDKTGSHLILKKKGMGEKNSIKSLDKGVVNIERSEKGEGGGL